MSSHYHVVPRPNVSIDVTPIHINLHQQSCLWLVEFVHGVVQTINFDLAVSVHDEGKTVLVSGLQMHVYVCASASELL